MKDSSINSEKKHSYACFHVQGSSPPLGRVTVDKTPGGLPG